VRKELAAMSKRNIRTNSGSSPFKATGRMTRVGLIAAISLGFVAAVSMPATAAPEDCANDNVHIEVSIENVRSARGLVAAVLYDGNPNNFLASGRSVSKTRAPAKLGVSRLCVDAPITGNYALIIYHDENGNREFDLSFLGRPEEGVGFSNNPPPGGGLPNHGAVMFPVSSATEEIQIFLSYP